MKKLTLILVCALLATTVRAQEEDKRLFNHLAAGLSLGTDGIGLDVAMPATKYLGIRAGISFLPHVKYSDYVDIDSDSESIIADEVKVEGKLNKIDGKLLVDFYPTERSNFHITAGAFIGGSKMIKAYNTTPFLAREDWGVAGIRLGDYRVTSDDEGNVHADLRVNAFKPYLGIGFGRSVPRNKRVGVMCDLGVQFWGKPGLWTTTKNDWGEREYHKLEKSDMTFDDNDDANKAFDILSKVIVYPVLSIRLCGRIF